MKITESKIKIKDISKGFDISKYSGSDEDVYCYDNKLNCRPAYQRNFVYNDIEKERVIDTIFKGYSAKQQFPLNIIYWAKMSDGTYQLLDGQQRTLSILLFRNGKDTARIDGIEKMFTGLGTSYKEWFDNYELTVYICEAEDGTTDKRFEDEILEWFQIINIAGSPLTTQELRNATYFGPWVSDAKKDFSNEKSKIFREEYDVEKYFAIPKGKMNRQGFLEIVLKWKSDAEGMSIDTYMSKQRNQKHATDLFNYFIDVLNWVKDTFTLYHKDVLYGRDWGRLYNTYHDSFNMSSDDVNKEIQRLYDDDEINKKDGIVEYILSGKDEKYLSFRKFDESTKKATYKLQNGICPICEEKQKQNPSVSIQIQHDYTKMEGDHIIPWSQGGKTIEENCCMLCKSHNGQKSDKEIMWLKDYMSNLRKNKYKK